ncbi:uncharacterized protein LOC143246541 [Tachypleus tridentatus]|uniref:uncharacterized protein LOC143246541 n=1 Tax=Tachypleus tridentatus TaxID=6853 RepID=UPI003FD2480E
MKQAIRACYGASIAASVAGILVLLAGVVAMMVTIRFKAGSDGYESLQFVVAVVTLGFIILLLGFAGCILGFWAHIKRDQPVPKEEPKNDDSKPAVVPAFHLAAPATFLYATPSVVAPVYSRN